MGALPAADLWGVGPKTTKRLTAIGIHTVLDLAGAEPALLIEHFGQRSAAWLAATAVGAGDTTIDTEPWIARSRSRETTFLTDVTDPDELAGHADRLARELGTSVVADGRQVTHVAVKVRFSSFYTPTKVMKLRGGPTTDLDVIASTARTVLAKFSLQRPVRLLGVRLDLLL